MGVTALTFQRGFCIITNMIQKGQVYKANDHLYFVITDVKFNPDTNQVFITYEASNVQTFKDVLYNPEFFKHVALVDTYENVTEALNWMFIGY